MATSDLYSRSSLSHNYIKWHKRTDSYYGYSPVDTIKWQGLRWSGRLRYIGRYLRLFFVGSIFMVVGGIFPLLVSYELFFKPLLNITCDQCLILDAKPYFEFDYMFSTAMFVLGCMMPIFVLIIWIKVLRNKRLFHDLFD